MERTKEIRTAETSVAVQILKGSAIAAFSACMAETLTIPMDTIKVRLQMQSIIVSALPKATEDIKQEIRLGVTLDKAVNQGKAETV